MCSETSVTFKPASRRALAVPPVDSRSTPRAARADANGTKPVLSDTERSAVFIAITSAVEPATAVIMWAIETRE